MNRIWSEKIQGIQTLHLSRELRFDDVFFPQYEKIFGFDKRKKLKILEIGCGPGALAKSLIRWYPNAEVYGIDRDSNFISYAKAHVEGVTFLEGDATKLPFADESFDVTISNTVVEHIEPTAFFGEQKRVLKKEGVCLVLSARKGVKRLAPCLAETQEEREFWANQPSEDIFERYQVGAYAKTEQELPLTLSTYFQSVTTGYVLVDLTPDDEKYTREFAERIILAEQRSEEEIVMRAGGENEKALRSIREKYETRLSMLQRGEKVWDTEVCITMILRGVKE